MRRDKVYANTSWIASSRNNIALVRQSLDRDDLSQQCYACRREHRLSQNVNYDDGYNDDYDAYSNQTAMAWQLTI